MKNLKSILQKVILMFMIIIITFSIIGVLSPMSASSEGAIFSANSQLMRENIELRKRYKKLIDKLTEIEIITEEIYEYDNIFYSQILGVDFDTIGFNGYKIDSVNFVLQQNNSIFSNVENRAFYAAEMLSTQLIKIQETSNRFKNNKNAILYYPTISPIKTKDFVAISSPYGWRMHPIEKKILFHEGVDISAIKGTPIYSTAQGKIIKIAYSKRGYGNRIVIKHAYGFETLYAHLNSINVKKGQWVRKNQLIGTVGNTGNSTGAHLHYEIRKNNEPRDPLGYFYVDFGYKLLAVK